MSDNQVDLEQKIKNGEEPVAPDLEKSLSERYGSNFQNHLIDQYKMYVGLADQVSIRRGQANSFYITLLSTLLALLSLAVDKKFFVGSQSVLLLLTSTLGLFICLVWYVNVESYRQLNSLKFQVINEMEKDLPFCCFSREWEILKIQKEGRRKYNRLTTVEKLVPLVFATPYFGLLIYSLLNLAKELK